MPLDLHLHSTTLVQVTVLCLLSHPALVISGLQLEYLSQHAKITVSFRWVCIALWVSNRIPHETYTVPHGLALGTLPASSPIASPPLHPPPCLLTLVIHQNFVQVHFSRMVFYDALN